jgi:enediyne biosynthesis protein E4
MIKFKISMKLIGVHSTIIQNVLYFIVIYGIIIININSCTGNQANKPLFHKLDPKTTGVTFSNTLEISDNFHVLDFDYIYNGGGVGVGDFNGDGLMDLYFTGNQESSRLYINRGNFKFEDVTEKSGTATLVWCEGVTVVDINSDGLMDIYVSVSNRNEDSQNHNLLFVNQGLDGAGIPIFKEMANAYGLADIGYNTQAAFFDYDRDGDLDVYILSNAIETFQRNTSRPKELTGRGKSTDKLYRNNGDNTFTNVSKEAGILVEGYGLGLSIADFNLDGFPDIYVANDFLSNDLLYINNGDGTFTNSIADKIAHQSFNAMGVDVADFNNDGFVDVAVVDMLPPDNYRQKMMFSPTENYDLYQTNIEKGYEPQYVRNTLQLNRGDGTFSEIGFLAGVYQTDWSWTPLFADFDNDGIKDLFISNGYGKDVTDLDYINFSQNLGPFTSPQERREKLIAGLDALEEVRLNNYMFKNSDNLQFEDVSWQWGMRESAISNGAVYVDLDNDGDLDLVTNNLNHPAFIYRNLLRETSPGNSAYLRISFRGAPHNPMGVGAKVKLYANKEGKSVMQYQEMFPTRGYKSSVEPILHFGFGAANSVDSLEIIWPDGKHQILHNIKADQILTLDHADAIQETGKFSDPTIPLYKEISGQLGIDFVHPHKTYKDFNRQRLLPHKHSELGPGLAVGDMNGDGLEDFFIGGSAGSSGQLFFQNPKGGFSAKPLEEDSPYDDMGCILLDIDADGDLDLYVVSGGSRYAEGADEYQDRIYLNDGKGNFELATSVLPDMRYSGSVVTAADIDGDGDLDLFVGGRIRPGQYPFAPRSEILLNENGKFVSVTSQLAPALQQLGMVTAALWTDYDGDGKIDLIVTGEWMSVLFFKSSGQGKNGKFELQEGLLSGPSKGWWNSISAYDFGNGLGYLLGNAGLNTRWRVGDNQPLRLLYGDFDKNSQLDPILFHSLQGKLYPVAGRDVLVSQVPSWKKYFNSFAAYGNLDWEGFQALDGVSEGQVHEADYLASAVLEKSGSGFQLNPLPTMAQLAPVFGSFVDPASKSTLLIGNFFGNETVTGRYDAGKGTHLIWKPKQPEMQALDLEPSGFKVPGEGRALGSLLYRGDQELILATQHGGPVKAFVKTATTKADLILKVGQMDFKAEIHFEDGTKRIQEFYHGQGYLSQSSRYLMLTPSAKEVWVTDYSGSTRKVFPK